MARSWFSKTASRTSCFEDTDGGARISVRDAGFFSRGTDDGIGACVRCLNSTPPACSFFCVHEMICSTYLNLYQSFND